MLSPRKERKKFKLFQLTFELNRTKFSPVTCHNILNPHAEKLFLSVPFLSVKIFIKWKATPMWNVAFNVMECDTSCEIKHITIDRNWLRYRTDSPKLLASWGSCVNCPDIWSFLKPIFPVNNLILKVCKVGIEKNEKRNSESYIRIDVEANANNFQTFT